MHLVQPDVIGLVVPLIDGGIQALGIQTDPFGQKLPGPGDGLILEIVAKGEIAQHLEEGAVARGLADILQIAGADALLAGRYTPAGRDLLAREIGLEGRHAGIDDQKTLVIVGNQGKAVHAKMSLALKELQEHLAQLVYTIFFHE